MVKISSKTPIQCKTTVKPIELFKPYIFNPDLLNLEYGNLEIKLDYYCVVLIRIDYRSDTVYISLTTESNSGEDYIELKQYIGLETESMTNEYTFMCTTSFCNHNYLQMISDTDELNWLLRFEYYFNIASSLKLLLVNQRNNQNGDLACYNDNQRTLTCKDSVCRALYIKEGTGNAFDCREKYEDEFEDHYIMINIIIKPNWKHITIIVTYLCNSNFCNSFEIFEQVKNLLNITNVASKLGWPSRKTTKFRRKTTTNGYLFISTGKEISSAHTKLASSGIISTTDANILINQLNILTTNDILNNTNNKMKDTSVIANIYRNCSLETTISTTNMITNNVDCVQIRMTVFYFSVIFSTFRLDHVDFLQVLNNFATAI